MLQHSSLPIKIFPLILSHFQVISLQYLRNPLSGFSNVDVLYRIFEIAEVFIIVHLPNIVRFHLFSKRFVTLLIHFFSYTALYHYGVGIF